MSRKDYVALAAVFAEHIQSTDSDLDRAKFLAACGLYSTTGGVNATQGC